MTINFPLSSVIDNLLTGVIVLNGDCEIVYANQSIEEIFNQSVKRLSGQSLSELIIDADLEYETIAKYLDADTSYHLHNCRIQLPSGSEIYPNLSFNRIIINETRYILLEVHLTDLRKKIKEDYLRKDQHKATSDLLRKLAHEIKNPLGGLRGAAQLLSQELDSDELKEYTTIIVGESDRLRNLVDRMLGPHKVEQTRLTNIHQAIEQARRVISVQLPEEVNLNRDYDPSLPEIVIAPEQIQQAILNLLQNAVQAVGQVGEIIIRTRVYKPITDCKIDQRLFIKIDIIDDGPGIDPEIKPRIFFPLVSGSSNGTGLGLNIAQTLVQQHDGIIECESVPKKTVFSILLPIKQQE